MMKRILSIILAMIMLLPATSNVQATTIQKNTDYQVISVEDGGYIVIELDSATNLTRATTTNTKSYTRYDEANDMLWKASLTGSYTYDGRTATCTSSSCTVTIYDNAWYTISKTAWADENIAKATVEMGRKVLGIQSRHETYNLSMVCDRYGNVS